MRRSWNPCTRTPGSREPFSGSKGRSRSRRRASSARHRRRPVATTVWVARSRLTAISSGWVAFAGMRSCPASPPSGTRFSPRSGVGASVPSWLASWSSLPLAPSAFLKFARRLWTATRRPRVFSRNAASGYFRLAHPRSIRAGTNGALRDGAWADDLAGGREPVLRLAQFRAVRRSGGMDGSSPARSRTFTCGATTTTGWGACSRTPASSTSMPAATMPRRPPRPRPGSGCAARDNAREEAREHGWTGGGPTDQRQSYRAG